MKVTSVGVSTVLTFSLLFPVEGVAAVPRHGSSTMECLPRLNSNDRQYEAALDPSVRLVSRGSKAMSRFYLASNHNLADKCGRRSEMTIFDSLKISSQAESWVGASRDCSSKKDSAVRRGVTVVGQFHNSNRAEDAVAERAWVADLTGKHFRQTEDVICHSFDR
jgi:hypothetical protein